MGESTLTTLREVNGALKEWIAHTRSSPDPGVQLPGTVQQISGSLARAERAVQQAPDSMKANREWTEELGSYMETLREVRGTIGKLEMALRIRRLQMSRKRAHIRSVRSWAELASHIG